MATIRKSNASRAARKEEALTARVQHRIGGPAKLASYTDPALVRMNVMRALHAEQRTPKDGARIACGELTPMERRVVRTVTNRGAAVRSRERTRLEVVQLRAALAARDAAIVRLKAEVEMSRQNVPQLEQAVEEQPVASRVEEQSSPMSDSAAVTDVDFAWFEAALPPLSLPLPPTSPPEPTSVTTPHCYHSDDVPLVAPLAFPGQSFLPSSVDHVEFSNLVDMFL